MANAFPGWLFNVLLLGGIVAVLVLAFQVFVAPILGAVTALVAFILVAVVSLFWPHF